MQTTYKICSKCKEQKDISLFNKSTTGLLGVRGDCKKCQSLQNSLYTQKHRTIINNRNKIYRDNNKDYFDNYRLVNKENHKKYINNRLKTDKLFKLSLNLRNLIRKSIKVNGYSKISKTNTILGCSFEEFKNHLESKFESWMTWDNHGNWNGIPCELNIAWDIDHIIPTSSAKTEEELLKLNHYSNLQPLCSYTNRIMKRNKINY